MDFSQLEARILAHPDREQGLGADARHRLGVRACLRTLVYRRELQALSALAAILGCEPSWLSCGDRLQQRNRIMSTNSLRPFAIASAIALCAVFVGCTTTSPDGRTAVGSSKTSIDTQSDATLARLYSDVPGAREIAAKAKGILVFPAMVGGSFVVGAEYGRGALRSSDEARRYYSATIGSVGWQVGAQSKSVVYMFTTTEALDKFRNSKGWTAGWMPRCRWPTSALTAVSIPPRCNSPW